MPQQYDFVGRMHEEVETLQRELAEPGVRHSLDETAEQMELPRELALAACHRSAKRSGYTLKLFLEELTRQLEAAALQAEAKNP